jgi:hypothetical protein
MTHEPLRTRRRPRYQRRGITLGDGVRVGCGVVLVVLALIGLLGLLFGGLIWSLLGVASLGGA